MKTKNAMIYSIILITCLFAVILGGCHYSQQTIAIPKPQRLAIGLTIMTTEGIPLSLQRQLQFQETMFEILDTLQQRTNSKQIVLILHDTILSTEGQDEVKASGTLILYQPSELIDFSFPPSLSSAQMKDKIIVHSARPSLKGKLNGIIIFFSDSNSYRWANVSPSELFIEIGASNTLNGYPFPRKLPEGIDSEIFIGGVKFVKGATDK